MSGETLFWPHKSNVCQMAMTAFPRALFFVLRIATVALLSYGIRSLYIRAFGPLERFYGQNTLAIVAIVLAMLMLSGAISRRIYPREDCDCGPSRVPTPATAGGPNLGWGEWAELCPLNRR